MTGVQTCALPIFHWRTTARRGELMVREYDTAPSPELVLVVEPWLPTNPTATDRERLEAASDDELLAYIDEQVGGDRHGR